MFCSVAFVVFEVGNCRLTVPVYYLWDHEIRKNMKFNLITILSVKKIPIINALNCFSLYNSVSWWISFFVWVCKDLRRSLMLPRIIYWLKSYNKHLIKFTSWLLRTNFQMSDQETNIFFPFRIKIETSNINFDHAVHS